jgi:hypothetical protein
MIAVSSPRELVASHYSSEAGCKSVRELIVVEREKRFVAIILMIATLSLICACTPAWGLDDLPTALGALRVKADQAQPRDRCFLYTELVSRMTDLAGRQFNSGNAEEALETLNLERQYTEKIHLGVTDDSKKLKEAELLMQHTIFRLKNILREASYADRPDLEATLEKLDQVQVQLMMQVFKR